MRPAADTRYVLTRLRADERGIGMIELLIAMVILNVGILATIAAFTAGSLSLKRANRVATAVTLADQQMERYRGLLFGQIRLDPTSAAGADADNRYQTDPARHWGVKTLLTTGSACPLDPDGQSRACTASRMVTGPDGRPYRVDTYIFQEAAAAGLNTQVKVVTVVVRNGDDLPRSLARLQTTFDVRTGS